MTVTVDPGPQVAGLTLHILLPCPHSNFAPRHGYTAYFTKGFIPADLP